MIDASILLKNKTDRHLNVFWQYDGKPWLENNITKALINTFESLDNKSKGIFIEKFFNISLSDAELSYKYFLQSSPNEDEIKNLPDSNKVLFAFSPTGKSWGNNGIDTGNTELIKESITESIKQNFSSEDEKELEKRIEKQFQETIDIINNRGNSIPDAWILIYKNDSLLFCIAMENKLFDLDPFQLNNHCEKSLFMKQKNIIYYKYMNILETLNTLNGYLVGEFLRYMYFLNYWEVTNLSQLKGMDNEHIDYFAKKRCVQLLSKVSNKKVSLHRGWMYKFDTDNEFNREIGMEYDKDNDIFRIPLYFGSTQNSARNMYNQFKNGTFSINPNYIYKNTFHFQNLGYGKNDMKTYYVHETFDIKSYIEFWCSNTQFIRQMDKSGRAKLLEKMFNCSIIQKEAYDELLMYSNSKETKYNICPEFGIYLEWSFKEAQELDEKGLFIFVIKDKIEEVYSMLGINDVSVNSKFYA